MGDGLTPLDRFPIEDVRIRRALGRLGILLDEPSGLIVSFSGIKIKTVAPLSVTSSGLILTYSTGLYLDGATLKVDHDAATNFVANEHIDHSSVSIATAAGSGLTGGGDITATRNLSIDRTVTDTWYAAAGAGAPDVQTFTSSGTWTKPAGAKVVKVVVIGGGGGGGGGIGGTSAQNRRGGTGGGGGAYTERFFTADDLGSTVSVTVGAGGSGGASGSNGTAGGNSSFGTYLYAYGGGAGAGGAVSTMKFCGGTGGGSAGAGNTGAYVATATIAGGQPVRVDALTTNDVAGFGNGGAGAGTGTVIGKPAEYGGAAGGGIITTGNGGNGGKSMRGGGGGGSGGAITSSNLVRTPGAGGDTNAWDDPISPAGGGGGAAGSGGAGSNGTDGTSLKAGQGGGGGDSNNAGTPGYNGGTGGACGGGGGGGGCGTDPTTAVGGAGGNGGRGEVRVYSW